MGRRWWLVSLAALGMWGLASLDCRPRVRVGTFNIRMFPSEATDLERVAETVAELDADVIGLQEIAGDDALGEVLRSASRATGREYRHRRAQCRHPRWGITTALAWDASRWTLVEHREFPELRSGPEQECGIYPPGLFGLFEDDGGRQLGVLTVHLPAMVRNWNRRREFYGRLVPLQAALSDELGVTVLAVGDFNSTGFRGQPEEERAVLTALVDEAGFSLQSEHIECTEYYRPKQAGGYLPSILDHVVATDGRWSEATAIGLCERLACEVADPDAMDPDYFRVSDHCPVYVDGRPGG